MAETHNFNWEVDLVYNPDKELIDLPDGENYWREKIFGW